MRAERHSVAGVTGGGSTASAPAHGSALMRRDLLLWSVGTGLGLLGTPGAEAQVPAAGLVPVPAMSSSQALQSGPVEALAWLRRVGDAARQRNYEGTLVAGDARSMMVWRVAHYAEGGQQGERIESLGGEPLTVLRLNDVVHKIWPRSRIAEVEPGDARSRFPALPEGSAHGSLLDAYDWQPRGVARVAGHVAEVAVLRARDALRFSQRLWAERSSGLLLRVDVLGPGDQLLEWSAFSDISIGVRPRLAHLADTLRRLDGYRVQRAAPTATTLEAEGWVLGGVPAGFAAVQCARRRLGGAAPGSDTPVLQAIYSDGLTHVSLFIEPFDARRHQAVVAGAVGATHTLMSRKDDQWLTAMGDVPMDTLRRFAAALQRKR